MTILEYKNYFKKELSEIYTESESTELFSIFAYEIIGFEKQHQRQFMHQMLLKSHIEDFESVLNLLKTGKPYQQILGETEFYGMKFFVDENVLIPRPETEELIDLILKKWKDLKMERLKILDIGTGSGIIPITLKKRFPNFEISAIDFSEKALEIAKKNADFHQTNIQFIHQDYLMASLNEVYDVIISNPPYIGSDEEAEITDSVKEFEPKMALFSPTSNPLIFYEKIAKDAENYLSKNGLIFLEINQKLGQETLILFKNFSASELLKDLSGNDRFVFIKK